MVRSTAPGTRNVSWKTEKENVTIKLTNAMAVPNLATRLILILALVNKNITVLFSLVKAILFDPKASPSIWDCAPPEKDKVFYMNDYHQSIPNSHSKATLDYKSSVAVDKQLAKSKLNHKTKFRSVAKNNYCIVVTVTSIQQKWLINWSIKISCCSQLSLEVIAKHAWNMKTCIGIRNR